MKHIDQEKGSNVVDVGIDLKEYYLSVEWDILAVPATRYAMDMFHRYLKMHNNVSTERFVNLGKLNLLMVV